MNQLSIFDIPPPQKAKPPVEVSSPTEALIPLNPGKWVMIYKPKRPLEHLDGAIACIVEFSEAIAKVSVRKREYYVSRQSIVELGSVDFQHFKKGDRVWVSSDDCRIEAPVLGVVTSDCPVMIGKYPHYRVQYEKNGSYWEFPFEPDRLELVKDHESNDSVRELRPGDRVRVLETAQGMKGHAVTLLRKAQVLSRESWIVRWHSTSAKTEFEVPVLEEHLQLQPLTE